MKRYRTLIFVTLVLCCLAGCGSGGGGGGSSPAASTSTQATRQVNIPYVSVTICAPGSGTAPAYSNVLPITVDSGPSTNSTVTQTQNSAMCQTIDHILVDTASSGLRIIASTLRTSLVTALSSETAGGFNLAECSVFASGISWGSVKLADVYLAGETASNIPIQIIADPAFSTIPVSCSNLGAVTDTVQAMGANGILGVSTFAQDCGLNCQRSAVPGYYYGCATATSCASVAVNLSQQVPNPVSKLAVDNNGVLVTLPGIPAAGTATATGSLIFGIATQPNNGLGAAGIYDLDPTYGNLTTVYKARTFTDSAFLDSGSNALFFPDSGIAACSAASFAPGFYCPGATLPLSASIQGFSNLQTGTAVFDVANADSLFSSAPNYAAFNDVGGPSVIGNAFDWGLPFFYGRSVFFAIETTSSGSGMYVAF